MKSYNYDGKNTPRQDLIHATVVAIYPALVENEDYIWGKINYAAITQKGKVLDYYMTVDRNGSKGTRLFNEVKRAVYAHNGS